jgi:hypothetical protein
MAVGNPSVCNGFSVHKNIKNILKKEVKSVDMPRSAW